MTLLDSNSFPFSPDFNSALHSSAQVVLIRDGVNIPITGMISNGDARTVTDISGSYIAVLDTDGFGFFD
jgi:hypothetical protein